jgi:hypothetical protein
MINLFLEGVSRSILAVSFFLLLQHLGINRGDPIKSIGITTVFTHIMIGMMQPNLGWVSDLYEKNK